jgi:DNA-binding NarL/FixJ family response regulator
MNRYRILLADDHKIVLEGLKSLLEPEFELAGTVEDGRALLDASENLHPDVIVVDISMPMLNGIEAVRLIKKSYPHLKIIFLTMHPDITYAYEAFEAGASGYVLKHSAPQELVNAIKEVMSGKTYITPMIAGELLESYKSSSHTRNYALTQLSSRQREVLQLLAEGKVAKEVAGILNISTRTVEFHKYKMMKDLGLKSSAELVKFAVRHGIVST